MDRVDLYRTEMMTMPRGNPNITKYSPTGPVDIPEDDLKTYNKLLLECYEAQKPDLSKPEEVEEAIRAYFERCFNHGVRPGNLGVYAAIGLTRQEVNEYLNGRRKAPNNSLIDILKKVKATLASYREVLGSQGKLNPATLIFWQKNFDGLEDVQRFDVAPASNLLQPERTPEELQKLIEEDIPEE